MAIKTVFETCEPRPDVLSGQTRDEDFAADLAKVIDGSAPAEYADPVLFFAKSYPTRGLKVLLEAVCQRLSGKGASVASIIRLDTQYGGGKTHGLIALVHAVRAQAGIAGISEFVREDLLPGGDVRVAAFDGDNADPANGLRLEDDLRAFTPWGQMAYQLAGRSGFERVRQSDESHTAPGAATLKELFGASPTLIVLDEIAVYLRKAEQAAPSSSSQFPAFLRALTKAVSETPRAALVYTLAAGKEDQQADDASSHSSENLRAKAAFDEALKEAARQATQINPTDDDETADVLRRRLFAKVDGAEAERVVDAYVEQWKKNQASVPARVLAAETREQFLRGYPLHPLLIELLTEKTSSLATFQRTRGMLRLLARTTHDLWKSRPADTFAIHPHHISLKCDSIRAEVLTRLQQGHLAPPLKSDVEAVPGDEPALPERLDQANYPGQAPVTTYVARTIFLNTLAYNDDLKGVNVRGLAASMCSPGLEPAFIEQARQSFVQHSLYLDDHPNAPMRFQVDPNLTQMISRQMAQVEGSDVRDLLNSRIKEIFAHSGSSFELIHFPAGPYEVPDDPGDGRPCLVLMNHEALAVGGEPREIPPEIADIFEHRGADNNTRVLRNNLVFLVADKKERENMANQVRRHLALRELEKPAAMSKLADYQQDKVRREIAHSKFLMAQSIQLCFRHVFYPASSPFAGATLPMGYCAIEVTNPSDKPGEGQRHLARILRENKKLLGQDDPPDAPAYVRDQTQLKTKGVMTTRDLRHEFRRLPRLSILLGDSPFLACIRNGVDNDVFVYRENDQVWGKGDPPPSIHISDNAFVHTMANARQEHLWPRPEPLQIRLEANPAHIRAGDTASLSVEVKGGVPPYEFVSSVPALSIGASPSRSHVATVSPAQSQEYSVEVTDKRGQVRSAQARVLVSVDGDAAPPLPPAAAVSPAPPPAPPAEFSAQGPLVGALNELFDSVRAARVKRVGKLVVNLFDSTATFKVLQAVAQVRDAAVTCRINAAMSGDSVGNLRVDFDGDAEQIKSVRSFVEAQLRSSSKQAWEAVLTLDFAGGLSTDRETTEALAKSVTRYGAGEAYVEAHAAPGEAS